MERIVIWDNRREPRFPTHAEIRFNGFAKVFRQEEVIKFPLTGLRDKDFLVVHGGDGTLGLAIDMAKKAYEREITDGVIPLVYLGGGTADTTRKYLQGLSPEREPRKEDGRVPDFFHPRQYKYIDYFPPRATFSTDKKQYLAYLLGGDFLSVGTQEELEILRNRGSIGNIRWAYTRAVIKNAARAYRERDFKPRPEEVRIYSGEELTNALSSEKKYVAVASTLTHQIFGAFTFKKPVPDKKIRFLSMSGGREGRNSFRRFYARFGLALGMGVVNPDWPVEKGLLQMEEVDLVEMELDKREEIGNNYLFDGELRSRKGTVSISRAETSVPIIVPRRKDNKILY